VKDSQFEGEEAESTMTKVAGHWVKGSGSKETLKHYTPTMCAAIADIVSFAKEIKVVPVVDVSDEV
ncbi:unnamed protein product, partial [Prorocentrum cordatum]